MKGTKPIVVTKRDGTLERFSLAKLRNCLAAVLRKRNYDPHLAGPLARAVALHLQGWRSPKPPTTNYIYRCVRLVLQHTGLGDAAEELAAHRQLRRAQRRRLRVLDPDSPGSHGQPWSKAALVETLRGRYGLRQPVARFVAGQIEARVLALDYRPVSKALVRELVRNELLAWGLSAEAGPGAKTRVDRPSIGP